jgi:hypothetical protein
MNLTSGFHWLPPLLWAVTGTVEARARMTARQMDKAFVMTSLREDGYVRCETL